MHGVSMEAPARGQATAPHSGDQAQGPPHSGRPTIGCVHEATLYHVGVAPSQGGGVQV